MKAKSLKAVGSGKERREITGGHCSFQCARSDDRAAKQNGKVFENADATATATGFSP